MLSANWNCTCRKIDEQIETLHEAEAELIHMETYINNGRCFKTLY